MDKGMTNTVGSLHSLVEVQSVAVAVVVQSLWLFQTLWHFFQNWKRILC